MTVIAAPGRSGPYSIHDVTSLFEPLDPADSPHAPLLARAATAYLGLPHDAEERRMIEHLQWRLSAPTIRTDPDAAMLAHRLADIIRPRA